MASRTAEPAWRRPTLSLRLLILMAALLSLGPACEDADPPEHFLGKTVTIRGRLTGQGVECPTLRDRMGVMYSLAGPIGDFRTGDRVCVRGKVVDRSVCARGLTIEMEWIVPARMCP